MPVAAKQLHTQFLFQLFQLPGQRWLSQMQQCCRFGNVFFLRNHQKISQHAQFHNSIPPYMIV